MINIASSGRLTAVHLSQAIPALPVADMNAAVDCYRDKFGFEVVHQDTGFAVVVRDAVSSTSGSPATRAGPERTSWARPVQSGAESFIASTASCRIQLDEVDELYNELKAAGVLHRVSRKGVDDTDFGTREFATVDVDGNLITFFRWVTPRR